jgi:hypothetical protein
MHLPKRSDEIAAAILRAADGKRPYSVDAGRLVGTDAYLLQSGERVIHLLNYNNEVPPSRAVVTLSAELATPQARFISPDLQPEERVLQAEGHENNRFVVDPLDTYALLVLPAKSGGKS